MTGLTTGGVRLAGVLGLALAAMLPLRPAAAQEAVIVLGSAEAGVPNYDPIRGAILNTGTSLIYDRLVEQDADQSFHPHLATSWDSSPDGMAWTFKLRQGVKFTDGEPFNAQTIVWWIPKYKGTENEFMVDAIDRVEAVDDYTVRFVMKRPEPNLIYNLASAFMSIPSPKAFDAAGDSYGVTEAVGTGPYKLESFTVGQETVLVRNDDYAWGSDLSENQGPPHIARLTLREIPDQSTAFLELKTGGVDMLLFYPGGAIMDRFGRVWVAVPSMIILGAGFILLPFTHDAVTIGLVAALMGLGNGISSGIVMTLGADAAPPDARVQFLGGWRLFSDLGQAGGPALISLITVFGPLAAAAFGLAGLTLAGSIWVARWVPRFAPPKHGAAPPAVPVEASRADHPDTG